MKAYCRSALTLDNGGHASFPVNDRSLDVSRQGLTLYEQGHHLKWDTHQIDSIRLCDGFIILCSVENRTMGCVSNLMGKGTLRFAYGSMPNACLFLLMVRHLVRD